jgi:hypothetical protein
MSRPVADDSSDATSSIVNVRGPDSEYVWPVCDSSKSTVAITSPTSLVSIHASAPVPADTRSSPASTCSHRKSSLNPCMNHAGRMIVQSAPLSRTAFSSSTLLS